MTIQYGTFRDLEGNVLDIDAIVADILTRVPEDGGSVPGTRLVGPISVNTVDLLAGSVTVYTPAAGEIVLAGFPSDDYVRANTPGSLGYGAVAGYLFRASTYARYTMLAYMLDDGDYPISNQPIPIVYADEPVKAWYGNAGSMAVIDPTWHANTQYTDILIIAAGHVWGLAVPGTSGASEPDWAANFGGTVEDGTITWGDRTTVPTVGRLSFYLLVATSVAP